jgi:hypothetical protein
MAEPGTRGSGWLITAGVGTCDPLSLEYCSNGNPASVPQTIFLARAMVGIAMACWRVAVDGVNVNGLSAAVLLNGAGVEAASTVIGSGFIDGTKLSKNPIRHIIA